LSSRSLLAIGIATPSNKTMPDATWHAYATSFLHRITLMFYHGLHYRQICRRLSTYGMNLTNECIGVHNNLPQIKTNKYKLPQIKINKYNLPQIKTNKYNLPQIKIYKYNLPQIKKNKYNLPQIKTNKYNLPQIKK
jgi:DNA-directed RNA polymerase subunit H (RpoH/RPB5)